MRLKRIGIAAALAGAAAGWAPLAAQQATTVQQDFDAATALSQKGDAQAALAAWETLERRTATNRRSHAIVLVRKSAALLALGRKDEAVAAARAGLAGLPVADATLRSDRSRAYFNLGRIAQAAIDYASAADAYRQAEEIADAPIDRLGALFGLIQTETYVDPAAAAAAVTRADALLATTKVNANDAAAFARAKGLLLLNRGDFAGARAEGEKAIKLLGGLTERTDIRDVSARSDTAIAALLAGDSEAARKYMAYTGAGRLSKGSFDPAVQMKAPDCGGEGGLKPDDMAVVEFSVGDDGTVLASTPIYAAGGGAVALEFARSALAWSWAPEQVKTLPPFFRYHARVEMRCSTAFQRPSIGDALDASLAGWLASKGMSSPTYDGVSDAQALPRERAALTAAEAKFGPQALALVPFLTTLTGNVVLPREERNALATRALAIADANGVPALPRLSIDLVERSSARAEGRRAIDFTKVATGMLAEPRYAADPTARATLRLLIADADQRHASAQTRELLRQVGEDPALQPNDPMRIGALVRIASIEQQAGDAVAARAAFEKSGLAASQCGIIDSPPRLLSAGGTFPQEAIQWGFEGWTLTQFDVSADGKVVNERAVLSYPPFIFTKAGTHTIAGAHYTKSYRPDGSLGCGASSQRIRFMLPGYHGAE